jgi:SAM-dependent methyltransferase
VYGRRVDLAAPCPACGGPLADLRSVRSAEPVLGERRFALGRCPRCGSAVTAGPPLPELHDAGAYRAGTPRLHRLARPVLRAFDRRRLALLAELCPPPARIADAGAGRGRFVVAAIEAGYDAFGLEPSERGVAAAATIGAPVLGATIDAAPVAAGSLDAVTLWHVLEHLEEPREALARIRSWLAPGGALLIGVPNLASLQARIGGERWFHLDVPRHRIHFTPHGLRALLESGGFEVARIEHRLLEHNPFGMWQTLINRLTRHPSYLYNLLKRNAPARSPDLAVTVAGLALVPVAAALEAVAARGRRGGTIAVLARRRG